MNNPHSPQEPQRGRTRLDEIAEYMERSRGWPKRDGVSDPSDHELLVTLAVACRDAQSALRWSAKHIKGLGLPDRAEQIQAILTVLAPLLEHSPMPGEGDTEA